MKVSPPHAALAGAHPNIALSRRTRLVLIVALGMGLVVFVLATWFAVARPVKVLPRIKPMPVFVLDDQYGLPLNAADLRGRAVVINFTYTGCGEACVAQRQGLVTLREALRADGRLGSEVLFLTISFDPARDTREVLQTYAAQLGAERSSWRFTTGDPDELKALIGGELGFYYGKTGTDGLIEHDQRVILIDGNGILRAKYDGTALELPRLLRDINMVQEELGSDGMMRQVYEASHLFLCYPP